MGEQEKRPNRDWWRRVLRRIRLWMAPVSATVFWIGRTIRDWWH